jgi:hypothetical protein
MNAKQYHIWIDRLAEFFSYLDTKKEGPEGVRIWNQRRYMPI